MFFHGMNKYMFNIGVFPIIMSSALVLFMEPIKVAFFWSLATLDKGAYLGAQLWQRLEASGACPGRAAADVPEAAADEEQGTAPRTKVSSRPSPPGGKI